MLDDYEEIRDDLLRQEVDIGGTSFRIGKLKAMQGYAVLESLRVEAAKAAGETESGGELGPAQIFRIILSLPQEIIELTRRRLFSAVTFTNARAQSPQPVAEAEDMAFDGLEPAAVYELLVRCLAVNFTPSVDALVSRLEAGAEETASTR